MPSIRPATVGDEPPVLDLIEEMFEPPGWRPAGYARERAARHFRWAVGSNDADVLLAVDGPHVVGLASVYREFPSMRFGRRCWLEDLVVTARRRSGGVGRQLLDAAQEWGAAHGCTHLGLSSAAARTDAHRFYVANGMQQSQHFTRGR
jgi:GNAT superfamily N-acetyltransferase